PGDFVAARLTGARRAAVLVDEALRFATRAPAAADLRFVARLVFLGLDLAVVDLAAARLRGAPRVPLVARPRPRAEPWRADFAAVGRADLEDAFAAGATALVAGLLAPAGASTPRS